MSIRMPCRMAMGIISFPEYLVMEGSSTSIELTPAAEIGAEFPEVLLDELEYQEVSSSHGKY